MDSRLGVTAPCLPRERSAIIPFLASNSPFLMFLGAPRLKQSALAILVLTAASAVLVSCGSNYNQLSTLGLRQRPIRPPSGCTFSFPIPCFPTGRQRSPVLNVVDGQLDLISPNVVSVGSTSSDAGPDGSVSQQEIYRWFSVPRTTPSAWSTMCPKACSAELRRDDRECHASGLQREYCGSAGQCYRLCRCRHRARHWTVSRRGRRAGLVVRLPFRR